MFETFKSGNIRKQLELLSYYTCELEHKVYQTKTIEDFIPNIQQSKCKKHTYIIQLDNIQYQYYSSIYSLLLDIDIHVDNIPIYTSNYGDYGTWLHKTPKAMLAKIKEHSKIFKQYNKNIKEYLKNNSDYIIEQQKLNAIFSKSK
ncbi:conserved hypothetical protein [Clostridium botulinum C str. Eklund]|nr:conserved hypothetical protein [Clostridium botulinum C str. Eklund]